MGRRGRFYLADSEAGTSGGLLYLCSFDNLCYCFYVISFFLFCFFYCCIKNPEMAGQKQGVLWRYDLFPE